VTAPRCLRYRQCVRANAMRGLGDDPRDRAIQMSAGDKDRSASTASVVRSRRHGHVTQPKSTNTARLICWWICRIKCLQHSRPRENAPAPPRLDLVDLVTADRKKRLIRRAQPKKPSADRPALRIADGGRCDERAVRVPVLLRLAVQGFILMVRTGWRDLKSRNRLLAGNGDLALRDGSRGMRAPYMPWQSIVLSQGPACRDLGWSPPHVTILSGRAPLGALKIPYMRIPLQRPMKPSDHRSRAEARGAGGAGPVSTEAKGFAPGHS